jgi:hypothetical protein
MQEEGKMITEIIDDLLRAMVPYKDCRCQMSDVEVITANLVVVHFFGGDHVTACQSTGCGFYPLAEFVWKP